MRCGAQVRIAYNDDTPGPDPRPFEPPPPSTEPCVLEQLGARLLGIPGWNDLMHHKFAIRDGGAVWTGSVNWTLDSWTRQENVFATLASDAVAAAYARTFEELWRRESLEGSGGFDAPGGRRRAAVVLPRARPGAVGPDRHAHRRRAPAIDGLRARYPERP
jgi:phosphatidylserine/phosphatidylglycerophosphate/cardiolipin synthase-like enzyme